MKKFLKILIKINIYMGCRSIDGTKSFRTPGNNEYCVAVALLYNLNLILSIVYAPEYEFNGIKGLLLK